MKLWQILSIVVLILSPSWAFGLDDNITIDGPTQVSIPSEELYRINVSPINTSRDLTVKVFGPLGSPTGRIQSLADYKISIDAGSSYTQFFHKFTPSLYYPGVNYTIEIMGDGLVGRKTVSVVDNFLNKVLTPELTFDVNKDSFRTGDILEIIGNVEDFDKSSPFVEIRVTRSDGESIIISPIPLDSQGKFQKELTTNSFWKLSGDYLIQVSHKFTNPENRAMTQDVVSEQKYVQYFSSQNAQPSSSSPQSSQSVPPTTKQTQPSSSSPQSSQSVPPTTAPVSSNSEDEITYGIIGIVVIIAIAVIIGIFKVSRKQKQPRMQNTVQTKNQKQTTTLADPPSLLSVKQSSSNQYQIEIELDEPSNWGSGRPLQYDVYFSSSQFGSNWFKINSIPYRPGSQIFSISMNSPVNQSSLPYFFLRAVSTNGESRESNILTLGASTPINQTISRTSTRIQRTSNQTIGTKTTIPPIRNTIPKTKKTKKISSKTANRNFKNWRTDSTNWPASTDFTDAIQNPSVCFSDPKFSSTKHIPSKIRQGLPYSVEGSFAIVFKITDGVQEYALKCFTSPPHGFENQEKLTEFFHKNNLDFVIDYNSHVEIQVQTAGIPGTYPTLISPWVKGKTLLEFLEESAQKNLLKSQAKIISRKFFDIMSKMESLNMAHGDLSGKNVMIESNFNIKLIDYDGIYIPEFKNQPSKESGSKHFQHNSRLNGSIALFDETMDRFSALVIYLSLIALSEKPELYKNFHDEDNLIFKQKDLDEPSTSKLFSELLKIPNAEIKKLTQELEKYCKSNNLKLIPKFSNIQMNV